MQTENKNLLTLQNICGVITVSDDSLQLTNQPTNALQQNAFQKADSSLASQ